MNTFILYCPHLDRDIRPLLAAVPDPCILTGQRTPKGEDGCVAMHHEAIARAGARGWPAVTVLEDDCVFTPAFSWAAWLEACRWADEQGFGALSGGSVKVFGARAAAAPGPGRPGLVSVDMACSAHCVAYFARGYAAAQRAGQPYDLSLGAEGIGMAITVPFVAVQAPGISGIGRPLDAGASLRYAGPERVDYTRAFARQEARLLRGWPEGAAC